jgi:hypothetical protein
VNNPAFRKPWTILLGVLVVLLPVSAAAKKRPPPGGRVAIVVDERLSALRATPDLSGILLRRVSRGGLVAITGAKTSREGIVFYRVNVTKRTGGWIQRDAVVAPSRAGDDARLLRLIKGSENFDRIARARIFLDNFRLSEYRPEVLMIFALAAEEVAGHLSHDAARRLNEKEMYAGGAPVFSYFMNYNGLDRYNRQGITFVFNGRNKTFHYDGEGWREILHRYPRSQEAEQARARLGTLTAR